MNVMKLTLRTIFAAGLSLLLTTHAYAQCSDPAGAAGEALFNVDHKVMVYCDNTNWIAMTGAEAVSAQPTNGLVAHWTLDETTGSTANDSAGSSDGNYYGGMAPATTNVPGRFGNAQDFDGTSTNYEIEVPDTAAIQNIFAGGGSISMWVYPNTANTAELIMKTTNTGTLPEGYVLRFWGASDSRLFFRSPWATGRHEWRTTNSVPLGQWNHIVVTFDNSSDTNEPTIYVNGVSEPFTLHFDIGGGGAAPSDAGVDMWIGWDVDGFMDDVRYYDRELTPTEISQMYNATSAGGTSTMTEIVPSGLVGHWRLDEASGSTAVDSSGNGNDGNYSIIDPSTNTSDGVIGRSINFGGAEDEEIDSLGVTLPTAGGLTMTAWINPSVVGQNDGIFINRNDSSGTNNGAGLALRNGGNLVFYPDWGWDSGLIVEEGKWQFVALSLDASTADLYLGDTKQNLQTVTRNFTHTYGGSADFEDFRIGADWPFGGREFNGRIDDVRLYNSPLNESQIQEIYNARDGVKYNESNNVPQFFDGNRWVSMTGEWPDVTTGLVGHWKFDETSGTTAIDSSGNGYDGAMSNGLDAANDSTIGAINTALKFYGTRTGTDYDIDLGTGAGFDMSPSNAFTISAWAYPEGGDGGIIFSRGDPNGGASNDSYFLARYQVDPTRWQAGISDGSTYSFATAGVGTVDVGEWQHMVVTWNGTDLILYKNTTAIQTTNSPSFVLFDSTVATFEATSIGNAGRGEDEAFLGNLDDVRLYNRALSISEIENLYKMGAPVGQTTALPQGCSNIGDVCDDGTVYAGISPDGSVAMFTTLQDGIQNLSWNDANNTGQVTTSATDWDAGFSNTVSIVTTDADSGAGGHQIHGASQYCYDLVSAGADDWYLPAINELNVLYTNRENIGGFITDSGDWYHRYHSSTEYSQTEMYVGDFSNGNMLGYSLKEVGLSTRCVRKGPAPRCANPYGLEGQMVYNADNNVMQYCDGARWLAIGKEN